MKLQQHRDRQYLAIDQHFVVECQRTIAVRDCLALDFPVQFGTSPATFIINALPSSYKTSTESSPGPGCDGDVVVVSAVAVDVVVVVVVIWMVLGTRGWLFKTTIVMPPATQVATNSTSHKMNLFK